MEIDKSIKQQQRHQISVESKSYKKTTQETFSENEIVTSTSNMNKKVTTTQNNTNTTNSGSTIQKPEQELLSGGVGTKKIEKKHKQAHSTTSESDSSDDDDDSDDSSTSTSESSSQQDHDSESPKKLKRGLSNKSLTKRSSLSSSASKKKDKDKKRRLKVLSDKRHKLALKKKRLPGKKVLVVKRHRRNSNSSSSSFVSNLLSLSSAQSGSESDDDCDDVKRSVVVSDDDQDNSDSNLSNGFKSKSRKQQKKLNKSSKTNQSSSPIKKKVRKLTTPTLSSHSSKKRTPSSSSNQKKKKFTQKHSSSSSDTSRSRTSSESDSNNEDPNEDKKAKNQTNSEEEGEIKEELTPPLPVIQSSTPEANSQLLQTENLHLDKLKRRLRDCEVTLRKLTKYLKSEQSSTDLAKRKVLKKKKYMLEKKLSLYKDKLQKMLADTAAAASASSVRDRSIQRDQQNVEETRSFKKSMEKSNVRSSGGSEAAVNPKKMPYPVLNDKRDINTIFNILKDKQVHLEQMLEQTLYTLNNHNEPTNRDKFLRLQNLEENIRLQLSRLMRQIDYIKWSIDLRKFEKILESAPTSNTGLTRKRIFDINEQIEQIHAFMNAENLKYLNSSGTAGQVTKSNEKITTPNNNSRPITPKNSDIPTYFRNNGPPPPQPQTAKNPNNLSAEPTMYNNKNQYPHTSSSGPTMYNRNNNIRTPPPPLSYSKDDPRAIAAMLNEKYGHIKKPTPPVNKMSTPPPHSPMTTPVTPNELKKDLTLKQIPYQPNGAMFAAATHAVIKQQQQPPGSINKSDKLQPQMNLPLNFAAMMQSPSFLAQMTQMFNAMTGGNNQGISVGMNMNTFQGMMQKFSTMSGSNVPTSSGNSSNFNPNQGQFSKEMFNSFVNNFNNNHGQSMPQNGNSFNNRFDNHANSSGVGLHGQVVGEVQNQPIINNAKMNKNNNFNRNNNFSNNNNNRNNNFTNTRMNPPNQLQSNSIPVNTFRFGAVNKNNATTTNNSQQSSGVSGGPMIPPGPISQASPLQPGINNIQSHAAYSNSANNMNKRKRF